MGWAPCFQGLLLIVLVQGKVSEEIPSEERPSILFGLPGCGSWCAGHARRVKLSGHPLHLGAGPADAGVFSLLLGSIFCQRHSHHRVFGLSPPTRPLCPDDRCRLLPERRERLAGRRVLGTAKAATCSCSAGGLRPQSGQRGGAGPPVRQPVYL